jgi:ABC-type bacteriocin/lantibiotic exporter with double-glycine peptidase domain
LALDELEVPARTVCSDEGAGVLMSDCSFHRDSSFAVKIEEELRFGRGMNMIVGQIGSGKTCFLLGMLGLIPNGSGSCVVSGSVAFATQTAFIVNASVRENILFGEAFDEERYFKAVGMSCLDTDIRGFLDGDLTEIGEKGINLSGGQRQRVSLARALYADAQILVLVRMFFLTKKKV